MRFQEWLQPFTNGLAAAQTALPEALWLAGTLDGRFRLEWGANSQHIAAVCNVYQESWLRIPPATLNSSNPNGVVGGSKHAAT